MPWCLTYFNKSVTWRICGINARLAALLLICTALVTLGLLAFLTQFIFSGFLSLYTKNALLEYFSPSINILSKLFDWWKCTLLSNNFSLCWLLCNTFRTPSYHFNGIRFKLMTVFLLHLETQRYDVNSMRLRNLSYIVLHMQHLE